MKLHISSAFKIQLYYSTHPIKKKYDCWAKVLQLFILYLSLTLMYSILTKQYVTYIGNIITQD